MAENSKIEWTDHTFNPAVGCTKVSPACDHCYAEAWAKRAGSPELWKGTRRRTTAANWRKPIKWDADAAAAGKRAKVFCASLSDVFDNQWEDDWRLDLWQLIARTPNLDWLLLTKRPQNVAGMVPIMWRAGWPVNVWLGATVENQEEAARRIPHLLANPARIHFLSCEPMLGMVHPVAACPDICTVNAGEGKPQIDWIICGGESGGGRRPMDLAWARTLRDLCILSGTAFFMKQIDKVQPIPDDLMIRQFPVGR